MIRHEALLPYGLENSVRYVSMISLASSLAVLAGCASGHAQSAQGGGAPAGPPPVAIATTHLTRQSIDDVQDLDGQVVPYLQANLATETSGTVVTVYANQGDHVKAGQILARIDDAPLQAQLHQQVGSQVQAQAKLSEARTQEPITETSFKSGLQQAELNYIQAKKQLLTDDAAVKQNELTFRADQHLLQEGFVSNTAFAQAQASYVASQQTKSIDVNRVTQAMAALNLARRNTLTVNLQRQVIDENRGAVEQADGSTQLLQTQIGETTLKAPFDSVVTQRMLDPGAYAGPNQPIFSLAQINPVYVTFNIKDDQLAFVREGKMVTFDTTAVPGRVYHAHVDVINVVPSTGTLLYPARLTVPNGGEQLRGGMLVHVHIVKTHVADALTAPVAAVSQEAQGSAVYAVIPSGDHQVAKRIPVKVGVQTASRIQVSSPELHDGMTLVTTRPDSLQDGATVAIAH